MEIQATRQAAACGALVHGVDLARPLADEQIAAIRALWLKHQVLAFPDQPMEIEDIERYARTIGPFGVDPYFEAIPGHPHVAQVRREAQEQTPIFAESWHSDWSFLEQPPAATVLYGNIIPPVGGDTLFSNQYDAWDALSPSMKTLLKDKQGIHSARRGYSREGMYGEKDKGRSMAIRYSDSAMATQLHPIARVHPETGRTALFVSMGYTIGIEGMTEAEATPILIELFTHQARPEFIYRHRWSRHMLIMWDNRCVLHAATRVNDTFYAIADPTRRSILDLLRREERSAGEIAQCFPVSRPAIAKHVRILREAGLVRERRDATLRLYSIEASALQSVDAWLAPYRLFWSARLVDLKRVVEEDMARAGVERRRRPRNEKRNKKR